MPRGTSAEVTAGVVAAVLGALLAAAAMPALPVAAAFELDPSASPCAASMFPVGCCTRVWFCTASIVRVTHTPNATFPPKVGLVVRTDLPAVSVAHSGNASTTVLTSSALQVSVVTATGVVTVTDLGTNKVLLAEAAGGPSFTPVQDTPLNSTTYELEQRWAATAGEAIYGGGEYQNGLLDWANAPLEMVQFNTEAIVPFFVSTAGYGLLWDNYAWSFLNGAGKGGQGEGPRMAPLAFSEPKAEAQVRAWPPSKGAAPTVLHATYKAAASGPHVLYADMSTDFGTGFNHYLQVNVTAAGTETETETVIGWYDLTNLPDSTIGRVTLQAGVSYTVALAFAGFGKQNKQVPRVFVRPPGDAVKSLRAARGHLVDYYVVGADGEGLDGAIRNYRVLAGGVPPFAKWLYGFVQCKEHYHNQSELLGAAHGFRDRRIPVDMIVQDWHYWGNLGWGPHWDHSLYPDPAGMVKELHGLNMAFMVSVWSKFDTTTSFFKTMQAAGQMINGTNYYDPYNAAAREQFYQFSKSAHFDIGVDALWLDATEPEGFPNEDHLVATGAGTAFMNPYSLMTTKAIADGLRRDYADAQGRRVFSLTRSAFAGQQRTGAVLWSGDISGAWDSLRRQVATSINYQTSGIPYWSEDIGGFFRPADQYHSADYADMLTRWFQFGVFTPVFRVHGGGSNTELWNYGNETMDRIVSSAIDLRYRMLPYNYGGFAGVDMPGQPTTMQRALAFDFAEDAVARRVADQFMWGRALMVAPLVTPHDAVLPGGGNATTRTVYMPGSPGGWVDFYTGAVVTDGESATTLHVTVPVNETALFARAGAILPLGPLLQYTTEKPADPLEVRVYEGADGSFDLIEDDGASTGTMAPGGPHSVIAFTWDDRAATLSVAARRGSFPGMLASRTLQVVFVAKGHGVGVAPCPKPDKTVTYTGAAITITRS